MEKTVSIKEYNKLASQFLNEQDRVIKLLDKIDKAIEYIKDNSIKYNSGVDEDYITKELYEEDIDNLLEILKGGE